MHFRKNSNHLTNSLALIQPLSLLTNKVLGYAHFFSLSGTCTHVFLGYIIIGGSIRPIAETHDKTVWISPFSAADRAYTCPFPSSATTLFGFEYNRNPGLIPIENLHWVLYQIQLSIQRAKFTKEVSNGFFVTRESSTIRQ